MEQAKSNIHVRKIQMWWRHRTSAHLKKVCDYVRSHMSSDDLQDLSNKCAAITNMCKGDGAGLSGGTLIDMLLSSYFQEKMHEYNAHHTGESDMKLCGIPLSQKKINGKSTVALDWSKNERKSEREYFSCDIMVINLQTQVWWKKTPTCPCNVKLTYNDEIPSGIYFIDRRYCKRFVKLSSNNTPLNIYNGTLLGVPKDVKGQRYR